MNEPVSTAILVYAAVGASAGLAQTIAPGSDPDLFWPAFLGAAIAGLRTLVPAFSDKSHEPPTSIALRALITITSGWGVAFWGSAWLISGIAETARPPAALAAFGIAAAGELFLSVVTEQIQKARTGASKGDSL